MRRFGGTLPLCGLLFAVVVAGCGEDHVAVQSSTPTPATGPSITFFGLTRADDTLVQSSGTNSAGVPRYDRATGSGFRLIVEGKPGPSGRPAGLSTYQGSTFPDLQIEASRPLGNGSTAVCDVSQPTPGPGTPTPGGVPAVNPVNFDATRTNIDAVNDLACRFRDGAGNPTGITSSSDSCVKMLPTEDYAFVDSTSTVQFCGFVTGILTFPAGDTLVTVRLRDTEGNPGAPAQLIIHVAS